MIETDAKTKPILRNAKTGGPVTSGNLDSGGPHMTTGVGKEKIRAGLLKHHGDKYSR